MRAALVRRLLRFSIFWLAMIQTGNPVKAIRLLRKLIDLRKRSQKTPLISKVVYVSGRYFWAVNIPGWPSRAFNKFIRLELDRLSSDDNTRYRLQTVIFAITGKCRLNCEHCSERAPSGVTREVSSAKLVKVYNKLYDSGLPHIQFSGGEPLERYRDLTSLIGLHRGIDSWLLTSGYKLTPARASELKAAGLTGINFSLDHWNPADHNRFRGNGKSFKWVENAVQNCLDAGLVVSLSLCATRAFVTENNLMRYMTLANEWGVHFVRILEPKQAGSYSGADIRLGKAQLKLLEDFFITMSRNHRNPHSPILMYTDFLQRDNCVGKGNRFFYVTQDGNIFPCPYDSSYAGNILRDGVSQVLDNLQSSECIRCNEYRFDMKPAELQPV